MLALNIFDVFGYFFLEEIDLFEWNNFFLPDYT